MRRSLAVRRGALIVGGSTLPLPTGARVHLVAFGKAAAAMTAAAASIVGDRLVGGVAVVRDGDPIPQGPVEVLRGEHPVPGAGSVRAAQAVRRHLAQTPPRDAVLFLISGGGSAILEEPADGVSLGDLQRTTRVLLASGAPIQAMNILRRHLSRVKGGRLGLAATAGRFATLAISDVVGDPPHDVASGPTVPDPTTFQDAERAVARFGLAGRLPAAILRHLREGTRQPGLETPKPGDRHLQDAPFHFAASNAVALAASERRARRLGYVPHVLSREVVGETRDIGRLHGAILATWPRDGRPVCLLSAGETTVTLGPHPGLGGRNQEFALAAAPALAGRPGTLLLSLGTDGIDGPTDAAGGWVDDRTVARCGELGIDLESVLEQHATYGALRTLGGLIVTGATGTNVMDLHVGLSRAAGRTAGSTPRRAGRSSRRRRS